MALGIRLPSRTTAALLAVALACAGLALLPESAGAQRPQWEDTTRGGNQIHTLALPPLTVSVVGAYRCALTPNSRPYEVSYFNAVLDFYGVCGHATSNKPALWLFAEGTDADSWSNWPQPVNVRLGTATGGSEIRSETIRPCNRCPWEEPPADFVAGVNLSAVRNNSILFPTNKVALLTTGSQVYVEFSITATAVTFRGTPGQPSRVSATRGSENATLSWELLDQVREYEIEREQAITIEAQQTVTTQYGNTTRFLVEGTIAGVDQYVDSTVDSRYTYRYRVRARGTASDSWGTFSAWAVAGSDTGVDLDAPASLEVFRHRDNTAVTLDWTAPDGPVGGYAVQRQELVVVEGSTIFANTTTLTSDLGADILTYTDDSISPGRTYEYRVAATQDGVVGDYSDWARVSPYVRTFGTAPQNLHLVEDGTAKVLDDRREFWMRWDEVDGADDYEVEVRVYDSAGDRSLERYVYTDPSYFRTAFGRVEMRTRGRLLTNDGLCGDGDGSDEPGEDCYTEWTGWYGVGFSPKLAPDPGTTPPAGHVHRRVPGRRRRAGQPNPGPVGGGRGPLGGGAVRRPGGHCGGGHRVHRRGLEAGHEALGRRHGLQRHGGEPLPGPPAAGDPGGLAHWSPGPDRHTRAGGLCSAGGGVPLMARYGTTFVSVWIGVEVLLLLAIIFWLEPASADLVPAPDSVPWRVGKERTVWVDTNLQAVEMRVARINLGLGDIARLDQGQAVTIGRSTGCLDSEVSFIALDEIEATSATATFTVDYGSHAAGETLAVHHRIYEAGQAPGEGVVGDRRPDRPGRAAS